MNVSLTPELERFVQDKVASGLYNSASEVIREALRLLREQDIVRQRRLEELRTEITLGIEQAEQGKIGNFDAEDLKRRVRERIENSHSTEEAHEQTV
jgi:antitoxin ParD1/3/4